MLTILQHNKIFITHSHTHKIFKKKIPFPSSSSPSIKLNDPSYLPSLYISSQMGNYNPNFTLSLLMIAIATSLIISLPAVNGLMPYTRSSLWDMMMLPSDDPFRILEQTPLPIPKGHVDTQSTVLALARADWKETPTAHIITLDVPGMKKEDVKIEVEENRVLRISGERKSEEEVKDEKWHRAERTIGKFWRQFRLPGNVDLDGIKAHLEDGVLRIIVPKLAEERKRKPKMINIAEDSPSGEDIKATKAEM